MGTVSLGAKRTCSSCGVRFFDLTRAPAVCPRCETVQEPETLRLKPGSPGPLGKRRPPYFVPVEKQQEPEADEAEKAEDEETDEEPLEQEDVDDDADDGVPPKQDD
ncbi:MAG: TIGR02300 family protein [Proteobacteria bacterium]|nr:TIGR02300 family protein [Pseudomonadota bacterium]